MNRCISANGRKGIDGSGSRSAACLASEPVLASSDTES